MIQFAPTTDQVMTRMADNHMLENTPSWYTQACVNWGRNIPAHFNAKFVYRYMSAFFAEIPSLTVEERVYPFYLFSGTILRVNDFADLPRYVQSSSIISSRIETSGHGYYSHAGQEYRANIAREFRENLERLRPYDFTRGSLQVGRSHRTDTEPAFSKNFFLARSVFWMRWLARVMQFASPSHKARIHDVLESSSGLYAKVRDEADERDRDILLNHMNTVVTGLRVKYGRKDVSLKEYWGV